MSASNASKGARPSLSFQTRCRRWRAEDRPASWRKEQGYWRRILGELGHVMLRDMGPHVVADYLEALTSTSGARAGQPASGNTQRLHKQAIQEYSSQGWKKPLKLAAERSGITRRIYPYLLRDSFATIAWMQGIPLDLARRVKRHTAQSRVLEEVYCRPRPEDVARQLAAFSSEAPEE